MPRLQAKSFAAPDDDRSYPKVRFKTIALDEAAVGYCTFDAGWRWSTDVAPLVGTTTCQSRHLGYTVSGHVQVVMDDGQTLDIGPDTVFEIPPGHDKWVVGDEPWVTIEWGGSGRAMQAALDEEGGTRIVATVMFTDIVNSTARLAELGDAAWKDLLFAHNARLRAELNVHRGREVKTTGDGFLAVFDSPTRAARAAVAMIVSARASGLPIRIGMHTGEVELADGDVRGIAVHAAARVLSVANADEVLLSSTTAALLEGSGIELQEAGAHELKGLTGVRQVYRLATGKSRPVPSKGA
jgi:class 3 adenylate cyclase